MSATHNLSTKNDLPAKSDSQQKNGSEPVSKPIEVWTDVCLVDRIPADRGVAAMVGKEAVAIFRLTPTGPETDKNIYAVAHIDPATEAPVMARGLVGSSGDEPTVASPLYKHRYSLISGRCLDAPEFMLSTYAVRVEDGVVQIRSSQDTTTSR